MTYLNKNEIIPILTSYEVLSSSNRYCTSLEQFVIEAFQQQMSGYHRGQLTISSYESSKAKGFSIIPDHFIISQHGAYEPATKQFDMSQILTSYVSHSYAQECQERLIDKISGQISIREIITKLSPILDIFEAFEETRYSSLSPHTKYTRHTDRFKWVQSHQQHLKEKYGLDVLFHSQFPYIRVYTNLDGRIVRFDYREMSPMLNGTRELSIDVDYDPVSYAVFVIRKLTALHEGSDYHQFLSSFGGVPFWIGGDTDIDNVISKSINYITDNLSTETENPILKETLSNIHLDMDSIIHHENGFSIELSLGSSKPSDDYMIISGLDKSFDEGVNDCTAVMKDNNIQKKYINIYLPLEFS